MQTIQISFHSSADKNAFVKKNGITPSEILIEGVAFIVIEDRSENFQNSPHVFRVTQSAAHHNKLQGWVDVAF